MSFRPEDVRALAQLAETVEDRTPHEQAAINRVRAALIEHERTVERSIERSIERGGRDDR
jgi:hypothetical protein